MQWLDRGSLGNGVELDVPCPGAVGVLTALVLIHAAIGFVSGGRRLPQRSCVILYVMLASALPFCSVGLMHGFFASLTAVQSEYLDRQIPTIRKGYEFHDPSIFPKLGEEQYRRYLECARMRGQEDSAISEIKEEQRRLLEPMKRFWSGMYIRPEERERFQDPSWSLSQRLLAAWQVIPWWMWKAPLVRWMVFFCLILVGMILLAQMLREAWIERENLPFPAAQLPLRLMEISRGVPLGGNPFFLSGMAVGSGLLLLGGAVHYNVIRLDPASAVTFQRIDFMRVFVQSPWNLLSQNILFLSPLFVGMAFLVHQEILRGVLWVFLGCQSLRLLTGLFELQISEMLGAHWHGNQMPYYLEWGTGGAIVFALALLWRAGRGLRPGGGKPENLAAWMGLGLVAVAIAIWWYRLGARGLAGMYVVSCVFLFTFVAGLVLARLRTEGGLPNSSVNLVHDGMIGTNTGGGATHGFENMMALNHLFFLAVAPFAGLLAVTMEGFYLGKRFRVSHRTVTVAVCVGFLAATLAGLLSYLVFSYWLGSQNFSEAFQDRAKWPFWRMFTTGDVNFTRYKVDLLWCGMVLFGAVVMASLMFLRKRFLRFPLPPICFLLVCLGTTTFQRGELLWREGRWPMNFIWGPVLLSFLVKKAILRFGGMDLYARTVPAALGLILSHALMMILWNLIHAVFQPANVTVFTGMFQ